MSSQMIMYNGKDLVNLSNKYQMSKYEPLKASINNNLLLNSAPKLFEDNFPGKRKGDSKYVPRNNKEKLLIESDKVFDDIEMYGLVLTNDLLKLRRLQQLISRSDFSLQFIDFRKRLYYSIDKTGDKMIDIIKNMREAFGENIKKIDEYLQRILKRSTENTTSKLENRLSHLRNTMISNIKDYEDKLFKRNKKLSSLKPFLMPEPLEINKELHKIVDIDWESRLQRKKRINLLRKINQQYDKQLTEQTNLLKELKRSNILNERPRRFNRLEKEQKKKMDNLERINNERNLDIKIIDKLVTKHKKRELKKVMKDEKYDPFIEREESEESDSSRKNKDGRKKDGDNSSSSNGDSSSSDSEEKSSKVSKSNDSENKNVSLGIRYNNNANLNNFLKRTSLNNNFPRESKRMSIVGIPSVETILKRKAMMGNQMPNLTGQMNVSKPQTNKKGILKNTIVSNINVNKEKAVSSSATSSSI